METPKGRPPNLKPRNRRWEKRGRLAPLQPQPTRGNDSARQPREEGGLTGLNCAAGGGGAGHRPRPWTRCPVLFPALSAARGSLPCPRKTSGCLLLVSSNMGRLAWHCLTTGLPPGQPHVLRVGPLPPTPQRCTRVDLTLRTPELGRHGTLEISAFHRGGKIEAQRAEGFGPAASDTPPPAHLLQPWH